MKARTIRYKGLCLGQPLAVRFFLRQSTEAVPKPSQLFWGDCQMMLDIGRLTSRQSRALPRGYACVESAKEWEPFIREMIIAGKL